MAGGDASVVVVAMGVAGCGKSTVGRLLAERLDVAFAEGDAFHPAANVAKMKAGQPLDDDDRRPWLLSIGEWIAGRVGAADGGVVACSALKRPYRDLLRQAATAVGPPGGAPVWFLHLRLDQDLAAARVAARPDHFMPTSLVASQFAALQPLEPDEAGIAVDAAQPVNEIVREALASLSRHWAATGREHRSAC